MHTMLMCPTVMSLLGRAAVPTETPSKSEGMLIEAQCERCGECRLYTTDGGDRESHERIVANARSH